MTLAEHPSPARARPGVVNPGLVAAKEAALLDALRDRPGATLLELVEAQGAVVAQSSIGCDGWRREARPRRLPAAGGGSRKESQSRPSSNSSPKLTAPSLNPRRRIRAGSATSMTICGLRATSATGRCGSDEQRWNSSRPTGPP